MKRNPLEAFLDPEETSLDSFIGISDGIDSLVEEIKALDKAIVSLHSISLHSRSVENNTEALKEWRAKSFSRLLEALYVEFEGLLGEAEG